MTDIHCHILHKMDDGAADLEESVSMAKIAQSEGITHIVASPHFHPFKDDFDMFIEKREEGINFLRYTLSSKNIPVKIISGAEVRMEYEFSKKVNLKKLCIGDSNLILVECMQGSPPIWFEREIKNIKSKGFIPILAHAERVAFFGKNIKILRRYVDEGLMVQINSMSITSSFFDPFRQLSKKIIKNNLAHFIATDAHNVKNRPPHIKKALEKAYKWSGGDLFDMAETLFE